jgi:hypothetical protein
MPVEYPSEVFEIVKTLDVGAVLDQGVAVVAKARVEFKSKLPLAGEALAFL